MSIPRHTLNKTEREFVDIVWSHYKSHGRSWLPWRKTNDPYCVLVSEVMCQQTQVERVVPKYDAFLKQFPAPSVLAEAPLGDVLRLWQGLGYNRRGKMLQECAKIIVSDYGDIMPRDLNALCELPGVGPYTAGAVMVFAFNTPVALLETNIRTAYIYHFFQNKNNVSDDDIRACVISTMDEERARDWFSALMDYGAHIKKQYGNQNMRSVSYVKQSPFVGSAREVRGAIVRALSKGRQTRDMLERELPFSKERISVQIEKLADEGMVEKRGLSYGLPR